MMGIREETTRRLALDAVALPGVEAVLAEIPLPVCMATSAHPAKLDVELRKTGLLDRFAPHIFRADMVARSKPAPDLFLYAAEKMAAAPDRCLVVEDSVHGIEAARLAGMLAIWLRWWQSLPARLWRDARSRRCASRDAPSP